MPININWKKWGRMALGGLETALDLGGDFLTGGSFSKIKGKIKRVTKFGFKTAGIATGTFKDFLDGGDSEFDWSTEIGDLKNGLAGAKAEIESQGKALRGEMQGIKSELQNELQQQGQKFEQEIKALDAKIANATGEIKIQLEQEKQERQRQVQQLQVAINQVSEELNRVENKLTEAINDLREEVNERFAQHEQKILDNKRKIEEEIRETHSKIKLTNTNLENLRQEKSQLEDEFLNYKSTIDRKTAETEQLFEDSQAEYERRTRIIETKMADE
ncbi:MAG: Chromosome partition protein Smc [Mycoplasmataceae bacterium]|nr:MAG: Chromosome partition protein Smc [Mycoplasmataceae bacterium]